MVFSCWGRDNLKFPSGSVDVPSLVPFTRTVTPGRGVVGYLTGQGNAIYGLGSS